jgi:hypothetical protein
MKEMKNNSPKKLEVLLWLALRQLSRQKVEQKNKSELLDLSAAEENDDDSQNDSTVIEMPSLFDQLNKSETEKLKHLLVEYNKKSDIERENWKKKIHSYVGTDASFLDENLHWTHIEEPLKNEPLSIRKIIFGALSDADKNHLKERLKIEIDQSSETNGRRTKLIEQSVQRAFAQQFTNFQDLHKPTAFDGLSGIQTVRLIRLAGIREVTYACARIEAVETLAAFLKRFPAEAARAIATQLNNLPKTSEERLLFAENLVQTAFENEPQPSAMLDLLGVWLIGIRVCESPENRIRYAQQKLPKEFAPELSEIIESQCRKTPPNLQKDISAEIEHLAETILKTKSEAK